MSLLNVVDVEATCWEGEPPPGEVHEIIEIGICVLDTQNWERLTKHSIIVRPSRSPFSDSHANVRIRFTKAFDLTRRPGMDAALKMAGLPLEGFHHRGVDDAWNIAALAIELARRGQPVTAP